ncbi:hypothetical protein PS9374_07147 [Planomonospora sphaerica]|uniref:Uncharacterized protein n=1 Tax=Planomonospora sphaerica TaxID=161355 RepID=A0A171DQX4_9ACTN|nr:hypothetical protein PS9374_07147 [Planomonospora sphaerica]
MGSSIRRAPDPAKNACQSGAAPRVWASATAVRTCLASGRSRWSSGANAASDRSARQSWPIADSTPSGPSSRKVVTPWPASHRTASWKRTEAHTWRTQYSAEHSSGPAGSPVTVETIGIRGAEYRTTWAIRRNSASIGSMSGEWNAWETRSRVRLRSGSAAATARTSSSRPEITTEAGPLTAAMPTPPVSSGSVSSSDACRATIAPPRGSSCINRPRAAASMAASSSGITPAAWAAASSPTECPARNAGSSPHDSSSRKSATSTANRAACAYIVWSSRAASAEPGAAKSTSYRGRSSCRSRWPAAWSRAAAKAGKAV